MDGSSKETGPKTRKINGHLTVRLSLVFYLSFSTSRFLPFVFCLSLFLFLDSILIGNHQKTETVTSVVDNLSP